MRVYEIAKEVGIPNKELLAKIRALGLEVNNHMSSLNADDVARIPRLETVVVVTFDDRQAALAGTPLSPLGKEEERTSRWTAPHKTS